MAAWKGRAFWLEVCRETIISFLEPNFRFSRLITQIQDPHACSFRDTPEFFFS